MTPITLSRRQWLQSMSCGFGYLALQGMCAAETVQRQRRDPLAPRTPHHPPRAKRVIFLFMQGGPSQVDTFDYKPALVRRDGEKIPFDVARTMQTTPERLFSSPWSFSQHGQSGHWISELFPHTAEWVDELCQIRSMHTEGVAHGPATLFLHTGATNLIRPSMGSWITYGLGCESENLPGFITISPSAAKGGPRNYSNAFLPNIYQGTTIGRAGIPVRDAGIQHLTNDRIPHSEQRRQLDLLQSLNRVQAGDQNDELEAAIDSYELAFRMQTHAPDIMNLGDESEATLQHYGIGKPETDDFGRQCLLARRFAEAGVRFVQVNYGDNSNNPRWDQHSNLAKHAEHARAVDQPIAGLLADLKQRGLLEDTLVWWGGEFGRTPYAQGSDGRDHNPRGFTVWLAGGGVHPGLAYGETDEFGYHAVEKRVHMHDLHATILHALGIDHTQLTHRYAGRDFRLTDVYGRVVDDLFA